MRGLVYLEWRNAVHQAGAILRSPLRAALWLPYCAVFAFVAYARTFGPASHRPIFGNVPAFTEVAAAFYIGGLGLTVASAAAGRVYAFRNGAEAVLFSNAGIRPLQIALWLQLRRVVVGGTRLLAGVAWLFLVFAPWHAGALENVRTFVIAVLAIAVQLGVALPAFLLARGRSGAIVGALGWLFAVAGFGFSALALVAPARIPWAVAFLHVDPGAAFAALIRGNGFGFVALIAALGALVAIVVLRGDDALPEMYAASVKSLVVTRLPAYPDGSRRTFTAAGRSASRRVPAGPLALVWKDWLAFRRGRSSLRIYIASATFSVVCGIAAAVASRIWNDASPLVFLATLVAIFMLVVAPLAASAGLASDLAKPLFWLSRAPLRTRIAAWAFARTWRGAAAIGLAPLFAGIVAGNLPLALAALPLSFAVYGSLQALGIGLFALFPNPVDARGPLALVRVLVAAAYAIPPLVATIVTLVARDSGLAAGFAGGVTFALEGWLVIELASLRFAERGAAHAISS